MINSEGFLVDPNDWTQKVAEILAAEDGIVLTTDHWAILFFLRQYYQQHHATPGIRALVKHLGLILNDKSKGTSHYLHQLFPKGPAKQASRIAGLPKPSRCM